MGEFRGVSEKFAVNLLSEDGYGSDRVRVEVGLDGVVISSPDGYRTIRKYPLNHISRWALRGNSLVLYTKTNTDVEEHTLTLQGEQRTVASLLDTLTCSCMQMVELLQSKERSTTNTEVTNSLTQLLNGESKKPQLKQMEDVEFWREPEKGGWMQCQGEVIKSWRRRWFVLKEGFLFRFSGPDVNASSKPRGVVDLSKVTDVSEAREQTGKNNSLKLSTETGHVAYVTDSETELVEWISALEGAVSAIVRKVAGLDHEQPPAAAPKPSSTDHWAKQLEKVYSSAGANPSARPSSHGGYGRDSDFGRGSDPGRSGSRGRSPMVTVVGYEAPGQQQGYGSARQSDSGYGNQRSSDYDGNYGGSLNPSNISGIAGVARTSSTNAGPFSDSFSRSEYPSYPVLAPSAAQDYSSSYASQSYNPSASRAQNPDTHAQQPYAGAHQQPYGSAPGGQDVYGRPEPRQGGVGFEQGQGREYGYQPQPPAPQQSSAAWQVHHTAEGRAYYYHPTTGVTQWEAPASMA